MKYTVLIDDETKTGAGLLEVVKSIARTNKSIKISKGISEDEWIVSEIEKSKKTGKTNKQKVFDRFSIQ